ncbi:MAG: DUF4382 domain-containing protein [Balneolaceae bacterium]
MMNSIITRITTVFLTLGLLFVAGCDNGVMNETPGFGSLEVRLHDAPVDFEEVNIFVDRVEVNREEDEEGWIVHSEPAQYYNLLELVNGNYENLGVSELEAGTYHQIRLILGEDNYVVVDGESRELTTPSAQQSGLKLVINKEIREGEEYVLQLDFDAARSIVVTGPPQNPANYILKPVIRASSVSEDGNIAGTVLPPDARPAVYAISNQETLTSTFSDPETGEFKLIGLSEGSYTVSFEPREDGFDGTELEGVEVEPGETTDVGEIELETE